MMVKDLNQYLLLCLALQHNVTTEDYVDVKSPLIGEVRMTVEKIKELIDSIGELNIKEGISRQFAGVIIDWDRNDIFESAEEKELTIKNIYRRYYKKHSIYGRDKSDILFKLYSDVPFEKVEREEYGRKWINYKEQLSISDTIEDSLGIWSFSDAKLSDVISSGSAREHYGYKLMIVKMIDNQRYFDNYIEFIGPKYKVIESFDLRSVNDYKQLKKYLLDNYPNNINIKMTIDQVIDTIILRAEYWDIIDTNNIDADAINKIFSR